MLLPASATISTKTRSPTSQAISGSSGSLLEAIHSLPGKISKTDFGGTRNSFAGTRARANRCTSLKAAGGPSKSLWFRLSCDPCSQPRTNLPQLVQTPESHFNLELATEGLSFRKFNQRCIGKPATATRTLRNTFHHDVARHRPAPARYSFQDVFERNLCGARVAKLAGNNRPHGLPEGFAAHQHHVLQIERVTHLPPRPQKISNRAGESAPAQELKS